MPATRKTASIHRAWGGWRIRRLLAATDPDAALREVAIPAAWDDAAADAVAALVPGDRAASLPVLADTWLGRLPAPLADAARSLLLTRRAAPDRAGWNGRPEAWVLNLAAFDEPGLGFDATALSAAAATGLACLAALAPDAPPRLRITDLDGLLAGAGLLYGTAEAREMAQLVCGHLDHLFAGEPDAIDTLLGAEAGGIAPRFSWLAHERLSRAATAYLAAHGIGAELALAAVLSGATPLPLAGEAAHRAMREALCHVVQLPPLRAPALAATPVRARALPARPGGTARRVTLGGHRVYVRTAEFEDGTPGEISLGLPRESAAVRALADSLSQVASLALQHGTPLADVIELLAGTRFGPAGAVDGDPEVARASSPLDYLARTLAASYLPGSTLPEPEDDTPRLPLEMPLLRLVG